MKERSRRQQTRDLERREGKREGQRKGDRGKATVREKDRSRD